MASYRAEEARDALAELISMDVPPDALAYDLLARLAGLGQHDVAVLECRRALEGVGSEIDLDFVHEVSSRHGVSRDAVVSSLLHATRGLAIRRVRS